MHIDILFSKNYFRMQQSSVHHPIIFITPAKCVIVSLMCGLYIDCYLANTWLVNSKKMWYGKQKHLRCKKVMWQSKTVTKRGDMRVWPRLIMRLWWKGKANRKQYICNQQIYRVQQLDSQISSHQLEELHMQTKQLRGYPLSSRYKSEELRYSSS